MARQHRHLAGTTLPWSGTFHGVGARLLRDYAASIGWTRIRSTTAKTPADLMNLARHELGLSSQRKRFPLKATCLAIYLSAVNTQASLGDTLRHAFPWCAEWEEELRRLFAAYVEAKQAQRVLDYDDLLLYWSHMMHEPALAAGSGPSSRMCWSTNTRTPTACEGGHPARPEAGRRGPPPWSATTPRASTASAAPRCATSWISAGIRAAGTVVTLAQNYRSSGPIPRRRQRGDRRRQRALHQDPVDRALRRCHAAARVGAR